MIASSSARTTRTEIGSLLWSVSASARLGDELVEQLVLGSFQLCDRGNHVCSLVCHGIGVLLRLVVLAVGQRRLGHQGAQAGLVGGIGEEQQLLVDDLQLAAQPLEPRRYVGETPFDQPTGHGTRECKALRVSRLRSCRAAPLVSPSLRFGSLGVYPSRRRGLGRAARVR